MTTMIVHVAGPGTALRRIAAVFVRHWHASRRSPYRLLDFVFWPVIDVVLYGSVTTYMRQADDSPAAVRTALAVVAGLVMWQVTFQAQKSVATSFFDEIYLRQLPGLLTTPLRPVEWVLGAALQGLAKVLVGVAAVSLAAAALTGFNIIDAGPEIVVVMVLLLLTGWALALVVMGLIMFAGNGNEALAYSLLFMMLPLSGAFYPISVLPGLLQPVAKILPTTYTFSAAREVVLGNPAPWDEIGVAALATAAMIAVAAGIATFGLTIFQRRGYISRHQ
jgi:ABC-2 type transport system permease protein